MPAASVTYPTWTSTAIEALVLELLADLLGRDVTELSDELKNKGLVMPVDSLDLFDILQEFRQRTGIKLPVRLLKRDTMRSVRRFSEFAARAGTA